MVDITNDIWRWYHNVSECNYHIQLTIKYRRAVLDPRVIATIKEVLQGFKDRFAIDIHEIGFDQNHVHILCQFLPKYSAGRVIGWIKTLTATPCLQLPEIKSQLWGGEFWTDGYYISTISNRGNRKVIEKYIQNQGRKSLLNQLQMFSLE